MKKHKKKIIALSMFIGYFVISELLAMILSLFGIDLRNSSLLVQQIVSLVVNLAFPILLIIVYRNDLRKDFKKIKKNYSSYLEIAITYYVIGLVGMVVSNYILQFVLHLGIAGNESSVRELISSIPFYMVISACIIAPFQEEMVFRKTVKEMINNKTIFIIASGLIFGGLHIIGNINSALDLLYILPYGLLGSIFAIIYTKTDNIWVSIFVHAMHNTILVMLQLGLGAWYGGKKKR